ncbi:pilus assembly protein PilX [Pseudoalteromonas sp. T1lg65]|uniref:pilus assembly protein PilX n=1 Tax=Pseudoalteromonas sp. T1lg65 TaxID=2077101 RepID=UPI003F797444
MKQQGVVLVMALVMVVAIMAIAASLMSSSTLDIKMTHAVMEREEAENLLYGEMQKLIQQQQALAEESVFLKKRDELPAGGEVVQTPGGIRAVVTNLNRGEMELYCPRQYAFTHGVICNMSEVEATVTYGSDNQHSVTIVMGVGQELVSGVAGK